MNIYKIITDNPYSNFYEMIIIAENKKQARKIAQPYCKEIKSIKEEPLIPSIVHHDCIHY